MSDLEYFSTLAAFVGGFVLLIYLFKIRARLMHRLKIQLLQAKAKISSAQIYTWRDEVLSRTRDIR